MTYRVPNGSLIYIASGMATAVNMTALTNATEAVATATNTYSAGDILLVNSGWSLLDNKVVRAKSPTGTTVTLEGAKTDDPNKYPAAAGTGTLTKVSGWTQLGQITDASSSGGDQQFVEVQFLESSIKTNLPTVKNPYTLKLTVADDPTLAGQILAQTADADRVPRVVRILSPHGLPTLFYAYVTMSPTPTLNVNQLQSIEITLSMLAQPTRYQS